jgi:hypothetical protein
MKRSISLKLVNINTALIAVIIVLVPFDAFLTVWASSHLGHYTALRLWDEVLLIIASFLAVGILWLCRDLWYKLRRLQLFWLIVAYMILQLLTGLIAFTRHNVDAKALGYGLIVNLRFLLFFGVCLVASCTG